MMFYRSTSRSRANHTLAAACICAALHAACGAALADDWTPDAAALLQLIQSGQTARAGELAAAQLRGERGAAARVDLRSIIAIAALRQPERALRIEGQTQLYALFAEHPPLAERGECRLALGIAALALDDTPAALEHLSVAADNFEVRGAAAGFADAIEHLATAWVRHADWERTPPRFHIKPPAGPEQTRAIRRQQFEALQTRSGRLPLSGAAERLALVTAIASLANADQRAAAEAALERLVSGERSDRVAATAALALAETYDAGGRRADVLRVLKLAANSEDPALANQAQDRLAALNQPAIEIVSELEIAPGPAAPLAVRARNIARLDVEIRRIDLGVWLQERQGRFLPAQLPNSGSAISSHQWTPTSENAGDWWNSPPDNSPQLPAEPGAYVLELRGVGVSDRSEPLVIRRLITVSTLRAATLIGQSRAAVWLISRTDQPVPREVKGRFWMFGSFQPTKFDVRAGVGELKLPGEVRVLRDRRWAMLIDSESGPLLLQGALPAGRDDSADAGAYMLTGATDPNLMNDRLTLSGALLREAGAANSNQAESYVIVVNDPTGEPVTSAPVRVTESGLFASDVNLSDVSARRNLTAVLRRGQRSLANRAGRFQLPGAPDDSSDAQLEIGLGVPNPVDATGNVQFLLSSRYPWGVPIGRARVSWGSRLIHLPTAESSAWGVPDVSGDRGVFDDAGRKYIHVDCESAQPMSPRLLGVWATAIGWDGRRVPAFRQLLLGPHESHAWLTADPPHVGTGESMRFEAGWIPPGNASCDFWPSVRVSGDGEPAIELPLRADPRGVRTIEWKPTKPGQYTATLHWPTDSPSHLPTAMAQFDVAVRPIEPGSAGGGEFHAHVVRRDGKPVCELEFTAAAPNGPLAAVLLGAADPVMIVALDPAGKAAAVPLSGEIPSRALLARWRNGRLSRLAETRVESNLAGALRIAADHERAVYKPGDTAKVNVAVDGPPDAGRISVVARLVAVGSESMLNWVGSPWRDSEIREEAINVSVAPNAKSESTGGDDWSQREAAHSPQELFFADGQTLWTEVLDVNNGRAELNVPVPQASGGYRLLLLAAAKDAAPATLERSIIARDGYSLRVFAPAEYLPGDRVQIAVQATASDPKRLVAGATLTVRLSAGGLLAFEGPRLTHVSSDPARSSAPEITLQIPVDGETSARVTLEALRAGEALLSVACPNGEANPVQQTIRVVESAPPELDSTAFRVTRSFIRMQPTDDPDEVQPPSSSDDRLFGRNWLRVPIDAAAERLTPGTVLLVREEVEIPVAATRLTWQQSMPANCVSILERPPKTPEIVPIRDRRAARIEFAGSVAPGTTTHEYLIVATRAGSCELPPPVIVADGKIRVAEMRGGESRLIVLDANQP
ncbi:MAG: hypothetical protein JNG88_08285 [Phycisphaerales bacterium]|nr:hypothetical protein [Phycisphaerales bacterium]